MIYTASNSLGASVYEVETGQQLHMVLEVDTMTGQVTCACVPVRSVGTEIETFTVQFNSIYPIFGGVKTPQLFHCYGRK